jgi:hypothetical protein
MRSYLSVQAKQFMQFPIIKAFGWGENGLFFESAQQILPYFKSKTPNIPQSTATEADSKAGK